MIVILPPEATYSLLPCPFGFPQQSRLRGLEPPQDADGWNSVLRSPRKRQIREFSFSLLGSWGIREGETTVFSEASLLLRFGALNRIQWKVFGKWWWREKENYRGSD